MTSGLVRTLIILASGAVLLGLQTEAAPSFSEIQSGYLPPAPVNAESTRMMPRCNVESRMRSRSKRYEFIGTSRKDLSYKVSRYSENLTKTAVDQVLAKAFAIWSEWIDLTFTPKPDEELVDIDIQFVRGQHGDDYPFDGPEGLAHSFGRNSGIDGDIHFNDEVEWTIGNSSHGVDLLQIAVHEIGHTLGLGHSNVPTAAMWPMYKTRMVVKLDRDDIEGIQDLYGRKPGSGDSYIRKDSHKETELIPSEEPAKTPSTLLVNIFYRLFFFTIVTQSNI